MRFSDLYAYVHREGSHACVITSLLSLCDSRFKVGNEVTCGETKSLESQDSCVHFSLPRAVVARLKQHNRIVPEENIFSVFTI